MRFSTALFGRGLALLCLPFSAGGCGPSSADVRDASSDDVLLLPIVFPRSDASAHDASKRDAGRSHDAAPDRSAPADALGDHVGPSFDGGADSAVLWDASQDADASTSCIGQDDGTICNPETYSECCGGVCSNATTDSRNCGVCGNACSSSQYCNNTVCTETQCQTGDDGMTCVVEFFGADAGFTAAWGSCCGDGCTELSSDPANCGSCGHACVATSVCTNGTCGPPTMCGPGNSGAACPLPEGGTGTCCSSECVDGFTTTANCGSCGSACPSGTVCMNGSCSGDAGACPPGTARDGSGECVTSACPAGVSGVHCLFGARELGVTMEGLCCDGVCTNPMADPSNCGACGTSCASGICTNGPFGESASCIPVASTPPLEEMFMCMPPSLWVSTSEGFGQCITSACNDGPMGYCVANGGTVGVCTFAGFGGTACVDLTSDASNCGALNLVCPSGQTCVAGACSGDVAPCTAGHEGAYCNGGTSEVCCAGGGCTTLLSDPLNCGECGNACPSGLSCISGHCEATTCQGATNGVACGTNAQNECCSSACVDVQTDTTSCGSCGVHCSGAETCQGGLCGFNTCTSTVQGDPCHLSTTPWYTGSCCGTACVDTSTDSANCGGCNLPCGVGTTCTNGSCQ